MRQSGEDYLETIYILSKKRPDIHAVDIANELNFSKPSVTRAMSILKSRGYITIDELSHIKLTPMGLCKAEEIYDRHQTLTQFLIILGVNPKNATEDACKIEHDICEETFECIKAFVSKHTV